MPTPHPTLPYTPSGSIPTNQVAPHKRRMPPSTPPGPSLPIFKGYLKLLVSKAGSGTQNLKVAFPPRLFSMSPTHSHHPRPHPPITSPDAPTRASSPSHPIQALKCNFMISGDQKHTKASCGQLFGSAASFPHATFKASSLKTRSGARLHIEMKW